MYKITCCRIGKNGCNYKMKGCFVKEFASLEELAAYVAATVRKIAFPYIRKELSHDEYMVVLRKHYALLHRKFKHKPQW